MLYYARASTHGARDNLSDSGSNAMAEHTHSPYLEDIPLAEALARWWAALAEAGLAGPLPGEPVALEEAAGRVTAEPVWA